MSQQKKHNTTVFTIYLKVLIKFFPASFIKSSSVHVKVPSSMSASKTLKRLLKVNDSVIISGRLGATIQVHTWMKSCQVDG